ncbi:hypothetical protein [Hymenobacter psychrophilus]|uniref:Uncharacterized protein n=1 Tax=Hymenobacter psychrophilus TaxID=651662 RepID=A0A1H3ISR5_9BACT|nr:hypothetical protein [Hymenobacter psychrophilus]SDY30178.1 hypothetical protein SAMN04488069_107123 [Hymenobacter psychrophilus]
MFTALQFSHLAAAAWSGPAACIWATASYYQAPGGYTQTQYSTSYHVGQACYYAQAACPFEAIAAAVRAFAAVQPQPSLPAVLAVAHAAQVLREAAAALAGHPLSPARAARPGFAGRARARRCFPHFTPLRRA